MSNSFNHELRIAVIGSGTIGLSFAALHLSHPSKATRVAIYDPRPDLKEYIESTLPSIYTPIMSMILFLSNAV
jgi:hypothetical protein